MGFSLEMHKIKNCVHKVQYKNKTRDNVIYKVGKTKKKKVVEPLILL